MTRYDYDDALRAVVKYGKQLYGPKFRIFEEDRAPIMKLMCWFLRDDAVAQVEDIDLDKGILLAGPVGCGKSAVMKILSCICQPAWTFTIKPSPEVAHEFAEQGYKAIDRYAVKAFCLNQHPRAICFDDLGGESNIPHYGMHYNALAEILSFRYNLFVDDKVITHITTNLNSTELEERYGPRLRSRMKQMFNLIAFHKTSRDKRRL